MVLTQNLRIAGIGFWAITLVILQGSFAQTKADDNSDNSVENTTDSIIDSSMDGLRKSFFCTCNSKACYCCIKLHFFAKNESVCLIVQKGRHGKKVIYIGLTYNKHYLFRKAIKIGESDCHQKRIKALGTNLVGAFVATCTEDGYYKSVQCHGSTGYCWCVDIVTGTKIPNTDVRPGSKKPSCPNRIKLTDGICFRLPFLKFKNKVCLKLKDLIMGKDHLKGCIEFSTDIAVVIKRKLTLGCFDMSSENEGKYITFPTNEDKQPQEQQQEHAHQEQQKQVGKQGDIYVRHFLDLVVKEAGKSKPRIRITEVF